MDWGIVALHIDWGLLGPAWGLCGRCTGVLGIICVGGGYTDLGLYGMCTDWLDLPPTSHLRCVLFRAVLVIAYLYGGS